MPSSEFSRLYPKCWGFWFRRERVWLNGDRWIRTTILSEAARDPKGAIQTNSSCRDKGARPSRDVRFHRWPRLSRCWRPSGEGLTFACSSSMHHWPTSNLSTRRTIPMNLYSLIESGDLVIHYGKMWYVMEQFSGEGLTESAASTLKSPTLSPWTYPRKFSKNCGKLPWTSPMTCSRMRTSYMLSVMEFLKHSSKINAGFTAIEVKSTKPGVSVGFIVGWLG